MLMHADYDCTRPVTVRMPLSLSFAAAFEFLPKILVGVSAYVGKFMAFLMVFLLHQHQCLFKGEGVRALLREWVY
jgi:hypothetical protein